MTEFRVFWDNVIFTAYAALKLLHIAAAVLTISGFVLRGIWMITRSSNLDLRAVRIWPHIVDTVFLLSGVWLVLSSYRQVLSQPWLLVKLGAVVLYILLGAVALKRGRTMRTRCTAFVLALITFAYIVGVAISKSAGSWLAFTTF